MGGNAKAVYRNTGTVQVFKGRLAYAERLEFSRVDSKTFVQDILDLVRALNSVGVWPARALANESIFFGSFDVLRSGIVPMEELVSCKPFIGDVDIAVPLDRLGALHELLVRSEGKNVAPRFRYVGQNRVNFGGKKINAVFFYERTDPGTFLQVDFEGLEFEKESPNEYVRFMRSSPWVDTKVGIKGLAHKQLLSSIAIVISRKENAYVLTPESPLHPSDRIRVKFLDEVPHPLTFSKEGLRERLELQRRFGYPVMVEGKYAYKELPKDRSVFVTDIREVFKRLFSRYPTSNDLIDFESYVGLLDLSGKLFSRNRMESIYECMVNVKLWGPRAQALSRDSMDDDKSTKEMIIRAMESKFPFLVGSVPLEKIVEEYYERYEERERDE